MKASAILMLLAAVLGAGCRSREAAAPGMAGGTIVVKNAGFATPESVLHDPQTDMYLVSNINGSPLDADDNGFISAVSPTGEVLALKWIDGAADSITLNAPKGMAVVGDFIYVADIDAIRLFDRHTGGPRGEVKIPGATFLNDIVAAPNGTVYFTDSGLKVGASGFEASGTDAVYRWNPNGKIDTLARGESLGRPNGIAVSGDTVWVVSYASKEMYRISDGQKAGVVELPAGGLDGLVIFNGDAFVSSWDGKAIYRGTVGGPFREVLTGLTAPADIGHDLWRNRLLIPLFTDNAIRIVPLAF